MTSFDPALPVQTRDGHAARILATAVVTAIPGIDAARHADESILAEVETDHGKQVQYFYGDGRLFRHGRAPRDLVNVPVEDVSFVNFYPAGVFGDGSTGTKTYNHDDAETAKQNSGIGTIGICLKVTRADGRITSVVAA